ncbi:carbohydrate kinase family protein [Amycolatopsis magusensis]|uniref:carbohydrate kinase family protein n=1 Tax=Amycolatopsis magusensis TaxID=882444 RepID=UPI003793D6CA
MRITVAGSIATDHLMTFPGKFSELFLADRLDRVSLSFLADRLEVRRGGVAANIAFGLGRLGLAPRLAGAVGPDFGDYGDWLRDHGVDTSAVRVSQERHTARFTCTTDLVQNQIATFYPGAMVEAKEIDLGRVGPIDLAVLAPDDPEAMLRHTAQCRELNVPFAADPSQQLATLDREQTRQLITGAQFLFTNEYEAALLQERSGWTRRQVLERVRTWITTYGEEGVAIDGPRSLRVPAVPAHDIADPTGVGDAFRAGYLAGFAWGWPDERAAQLGCALATAVLETVGPQEYKLVASDLAARAAESYGQAAADRIEAGLAEIA